jgi:hypothetical protein
MEWKKKKNLSKWIFHPWSMKAGVVERCVQSWFRTILQSFKLNKIIRGMLLITILVSSHQTSILPLT